jgi:hypothetical protein
MVSLDDLQAQVKKNCDISDSRYWGHYSLCGLLLRLRELYRSESRIEPWESLPEKDVGKWVASKEALWAGLEAEEYRPIVLNGHAYDPFDIDEINRQIEERGLVYGAGIGRHGKPSFFLADILSSNTLEGFMVLTSGREYARDLSEYPAAFRDGTIFVRVELTQLLLWQSFQELGCRRVKTPLVYAFERYGISREDNSGIEMKLRNAALSEAGTYIFHELGEAVEGERLGSQWKDILLGMEYGRAEVFLRAVKDILADTTGKGMLSHIIEQGKEASLGFYVVFLKGMRKVLFPEMAPAFASFSCNGDWAPIEAARCAGYERASTYCDQILTLRREDGEQKMFTEAIERSFLNESG